MGLGLFHAVLAHHSDNHRRPGRIGGVSGGISRPSGDLYRLSLSYVTCGDQ